MQHLAPANTTEIVVSGLRIFKLSVGEKKIWEPLVQRVGWILWEPFSDRLQGADQGDP